MVTRRISDVENQIGAGLIEEVIQVAEGEMKLVDTMIESKVYVSCRIDRGRAYSFRTSRALTLNTGGRSSKRNRNPANGTTLQGTSIPQGLKSRRTNRCTYEKPVSLLSLVPTLCLVFEFSWSFCYELCSTVIISPRTSKSRSNLNESVMLLHNSR